MCVSDRTIDILDSHRQNIAHKMGNCFSSDRRSDSREDRAVGVSPFIPTQTPIDPTPSLPPIENPPGNSLFLQLSGLLFIH